MEKLRKRSATSRISSNWNDDDSHSGGGGGAGGDGAGD
jgi:hypothetical protein